MVVVAAVTVVLYVDEVDVRSGVDVVVVLGSIVLNFFPPVAEPKIPLKSTFR